MTAASSRRRFLAGLVALPAVGAPPTPAAVAVAADAPPHPDQALLDAERDFHEAIAAECAADAAHRDAQAAYVAERTPYPDALTLTWEDREISSIRTGLDPYRGLCHRTETGHWFAHTETLHIRLIWTGANLRYAIKSAPAALGRGGRTPHLIRRWRDLLPIADAHDAEAEALSDRFEVDALSQALREARAHREDLRTRVAMLPVSTIDGLAAKVRLYRDFCGPSQGQHFITLIQAAAAICGETLIDRDPDFDPAVWAGDIAALGGRVNWRRDPYAYDVSWPDECSGNAWADRARELRNRSDVNRHKVAAWLWRRGPA